MSQQNEIQQNSFNITEPMLLSLSQTKPWARLLSIIGFIFIGFMAIVGITNFLVFSKTVTEGAFFPSVVFAVLYILMALLYFFPSLFLFKFASSTGRLLDGGRAIEMEEALLNQKSFWKFAGILTLISFGMSILGIVAAIAIPQFMKMTG